MLLHLSFLSFAVGTYADTSCCQAKERSISYLDIAVDAISRAKLTIPACEEKEKLPDPKPTDCADWYVKGYNKSGVYTIWPISRLIFNKSLDVFCDMDTDGGGWTVIQRRGDFGNPNDYFFREWASYKTGFGKIDEDFWLGNDNIFALTNQKPYSIHIDLQAWNLTKAFAKYGEFWIDDENHKYMLHISKYSGNAGDCMSGNNKRYFTTKDQDNDSHSTENCGKYLKGAWWYLNCGDSDLNAIYNAKDYGIRWNKFNKYPYYSLKWTEMKIRPTNLLNQKSTCT